MLLTQRESIKNEKNYDEENQIQLDRAPAHSTLPVQKFSDKKFPGKWIRLE